MGDDARLMAIAQEASERLAWLDTHERTHPLATRHGHPSAFQVLASIAQARAERIQARRHWPSQER
jgi:hypothetical protein